MSKKNFCFSLHYNGANSYLFVHGKEMIKFKVKDSEIVVRTIRLANILENFSVTNMRKTGLYGFVHDFNIDYRAIGVKKILDIHRHP